MTVAEAVAGRARGARHGVSARWAAAAGVLGPAGFGLMVVLLTVAQYDALRALGWRPVGDSPLPWPSALALGPYGWIQVANFVALGLLVLALAAGLRRGLPGGPGAAAGPRLLAVAGAGLVLLGAKTDPVAPPQSLHGWVHLGAFLLTAAALLAACAAFWRLLRRDARWRGAGRCSLGAGLLVAASLALPGAVAGYVFVAVLVVWLEVLAVRLWDVATPPGGTRSGRGRRRAEHVG